MNLSKRKILYFINNKKIFSFFLVLLLLIFLSSILPKDLFLQSRTEYQFLEIIQTFILIYILVVQFQFRKLFLRESNFFTYLIRQIFVLFILYEELSFLFSNINLHNSYLMDYKLFSLTIPLNNFTYTLNSKFFLYSLTLFIFGYGSYFSFFKKIRYFFLDKQFAIYSFLYCANTVISSLMVDFNITYSIYIKGEVLELFFYSLFLIDTLKKRRIMSEKLII